MFTKCASLGLGEMLTMQKPRLLGPWLAVTLVNCAKGVNVTKCPQESTAHLFGPAQNCQHFRTELLPRSVPYIACLVLLGWPHYWSYKYEDWKIRGVSFFQDFSVSGPGDYGYLLVNVRAVIKALLLSANQS